MSETGESAGVEPSPPPTSQVEGSSPLDPEAPPTTGPLSPPSGAVTPPPAPPAPPVPPTPAAGSPPPPPNGARRRWAERFVAALAGFVLAALVLGVVGLVVRDHRRDRFADVRDRIGDVRDRWRDGGDRGADDDRGGPSVGMPGSGMPGARPGSSSSNDAGSGSTSPGSSGQVTGPTVVEGGGPNGEDVVVWPDGRTVTLPGADSTTTTQPS